MRQQINLYQPIFIERSTGLTARMFGLAMGVLLAALIGLGVFGHVRVRQLEQTVATMRTQQAHQQALLASAAALPQLQGAEPAVVEARVKKLERAVHERRMALEVLQSGAAGQTRGFAARLEALARRHVEGVWIDHLALSGGDGSMSLDGATFNPDLVPRYLQSLAQEAVLSGARFDDFVIERPGAEADAEGVVRKAPATGEVRFRAGARSLAPTTTPESAT